MITNLCAFGSLAWLGCKLYPPQSRETSYPQSSQVLTNASTVYNPDAVTQHVGSWASRAQYVLLGSMLLTDVAGHVEVSRFALNHQAVPNHTINFKQSDVLTCASIGHNHVDAPKCFCGATHELRESAASEGHLFT